MGGGLLLARADAALRAQLFEDGFSEHEVADTIRASRTRDDS